MNDIIYGCPITLKDSEVLKDWIGDPKSKEYRQNKGYHTGVDIVAENVYSICAGVCTYVGKSSEERNVVIVQYDHNVSFRYCNLDVVSVRKGQTVDYQMEVGVAHEWVHFEVITTTFSDWCVRVGGRDYYKQNPSTYARGAVDYSESGTVEDFQFHDVDTDLQTQF